MNALDGVLADLVESDRECAYVTVRRAPLEALIGEWLTRGDQISILNALVARAQKELARLWATPIPELMRRPRSEQAILQELNCAMAQQFTTIAHHRHAVRQELAAKLKQALRSAITEIHQHVTGALLKGDSELAQRLESERQTVQLVINAIDATVSWFMAQELAKASQEGGRNATPEG
jgi:hypothetical protein